MKVNMIHFFIPSLFLFFHTIISMQSSELLILTNSFLTRIHNLKKEDIIPLREVIREHNRLYHDLESPIIGDTEYDQLFHALARLESDHDMFDESSPTAKLAIIASGQFKKVKHVYPMISLDNTYSVEEVRDWNDRMIRILDKSDNASKWNNLSYYIQPKYDGLGLAVIYEYGKLKQAVTRGSGVEGEDVTLGAFEIEDIPKEIDALKNTPRMEIRGEVMMSRTEFDRVNRERLELGEKLFANPRNAASGSLRQLDPLITRSRKLQFFAYAIPQIEQDDGFVIPAYAGILVDNKQDSGTSSKWHIQTYSGMMDLLTSWGFERQDFPFTLVEGIERLIEIIEHENQNRIEHFDFDIDGMVLKLDDMTLWDDLGRTEHHPRYAIAYKFPAKQVRTKVISIEHSVGRTGTVTPVANLEAVNVWGVVVRRATLHNYDELTKKWVREGDSVFIMRAGEVIPEIVSVISEVRTGAEKEVSPPETCPICSTKLLKDEGKVAIYCPNPHCPAKIQGQLEMFVGKQGFNIDGLWVRQIELFLELGWITDFVSVFHLGKYKEQFLELEWYKEKSVSNLIEAIEKARRTTLDRVFVALWIPNVGKKTAKLIASLVYNRLSVMSSEAIAESRHLTHEVGKDFSTLLTSFIPLEMTELLISLTEEELYEVKDIGPETARAFVEYVEENSLLIKRLLHELQIEMPEVRFQPSQEWQENSSEIFGRSFCVTGGFEGISRDEIHELIEKHGGEVRTSVSAKLDYLIVGSDAGSKKTKAEDLGVKCIGIEELKALIH
jgi:DNA ligase (NAD+)